jgi:hypothetical protein
MVSVLMLRRMAHPLKKQRQKTSNIGQCRRLTNAIRPSAVCAPQQIPKEYSARGMRYDAGIA